MIVEILLGVIVVELAVVLWIGRESDAPEPRSEKVIAPPAADPIHSLNPEGDDLVALQRDLKVEALIQAVDPEWKLGDDRSHIELVAGPDGHIAEARLR